MGKLEKKKEQLPLHNDPNKQMKISTFFQNPSTSSTQTQSQLFSCVGSERKPSKLSINKPAKKKFSISEKTVNTHSSSFTTVRTKSTNECGGLSSTEPVIVPETQFLTPQKPDPGSALSNPGASPDVVLIPDTPEEDRGGPQVKKKVFCSRSFLSMNANPIVRVKPTKIEKRRVSKLTGKISVSFNNFEATSVADGSERRDDVCNDVVDVDTGESSNAVTPTKTYQSDRVKRLSKSGLSPTPKRSLCLDSISRTEYVENLTHGCGESSDTLCKEDNLEGRKTTTVHKILSHMSSSKMLGNSRLSKRLTHYQLGTSSAHGSAETEHGSDDLLGELLCELDMKSNVKRTKSKENRPVSKPRKSSKLDVGPMTEDELALFKTLDESFTTASKATSPDSESPSILSKRKPGNKITPVRNILNSETNSSLNPFSVVSSIKSDPKESEKSKVRINNGDLGVTSQSEDVDIELFPTQTCQGDVEDSTSTGQKGRLEFLDADKVHSPRRNLCGDFTRLTPFSGDLDNMDTSEALPRLPESICPASRFNRFRVTAVTCDRDAVHLDLESEDATTEGEKNTRKCVLHGFWADTQVAEGDIVHIICDFNDDGVCHVTDQTGLIVVCPDLLLSGTSVVSAVYCMRRSVLSEKFKGCSDERDGNIHMLVGSIIHTMFQQVLKQGLTTEKQMESMAVSVMQLNKFLHEMYSHSTNETIVKEAIDNYLPPFKKWVDKYSALVSQSSNGTSSDLKVLKVHDIEENIWSPRFGIKGKIDLTVEVQLPRSRKKKVLPLELKTGKPTFSIEHRGQVTLYSMMMSDRRSDPEEGVLLYLREPVMTNVAVKGDNKRGLIQLRNELAHYVSQQVTKTTTDDHTTYQYGALPAPINNVRSCSNCPQLLNCALYQRHVEHRSHNKGHAMDTLVPEALGHLKAPHIEYYLHWSVCLELEKQVERGQKVKDIWCCSSQKRELRGDCLAGMVIEQTHVEMVTDSQRFAEGESCIITFTRRPDFLRHFPSALHTLGFSANDMVAISSDDGRLLVLALGIISRITATVLDVVVDRDIFHKDAFLKNLTYRLDRCDNFNTAGYLFTNLSRLLANQHSRAKLRELVIERRRPEFQLTMSKSTVEQVKSIFKSLNKPQKTVILKVLMSKDYVLIKGYPGTGKTSTIVALVRILHRLGQSVLLTSYTHSAVDNILLKLMKHDVDFLRLGRLARIHPDVHGYSAEHLTSKITSVQELKDFYDSQRIVATSCLGTNHPLFSRRRFDVCIVDEASQVLQPACLAPLFSADRFVLVGDPHQLSPVVQSHDSSFRDSFTYITACQLGQEESCNVAVNLELGMSESLFARLDDTGATFDLHLQYRMNKTIMQLSNDLVYDGKLQCGSVAVADGHLVLSRRPAAGHAQTGRPWMESVLTSDLAMAAIFLNTNMVPAVEVSDGRGMLKNITEADLVLIIVTTLEECGVPLGDIGVIAPYRHQVKLLQQRLHERHLEAVEANTVDQYQGRDKSVIVMSFVRSGVQSGKTELLQDIRRLNVAVTRAKHKLILIGDVPTLRQYQPLQTIISTMESNHQIVALPPDAHR